MDYFKTLLQDAKRVEIVINKSHIEDALNILDQVNVSGYTVIEDSSGKGDRGESCLDVGCIFSSQSILTVCTNDRQLKNLVEKLKPLLKKAGGVCLVSDAKWINH